MAASTTTKPRKIKKPWYKDLFKQVLIAVVLGMIVGHYYPETSEDLRYLGDAFINLIKMMIAPIIFCTIVTGVAGVGNMSQAGRVGFKALIYFEIVTTVALLIGMVAVDVLKPGAGMAVNASIDSSTLELMNKKASTHLSTTSEFLMAIIPHTAVSAFTDGNILQVLLIALLFAAGVAMMGDKGKPIVTGVEAISHVVFHIIAIIVKLAPLGVFGAMAFAISKFGFASLKELGELMLVFFGSCILFITVVLGSIMRFYCKLSLWQFIRYIREEMAISFGTASTETVLPRMLDKLTALGCAKPVVGMVLPTGYSFNLDGTTLYLSLAAIFIAYATGVDLTIGQQLAIVGVLLITSKGAAGVYGSAFVVLAATISTFNIFPPDKLAIAMALLFSIDRIMAPGRVLTNLIGNGVATMVIAKWEKALDYEQAKAVLSGKRVPVLDSVDPK